MAGKKKSTKSTRPLSSSFPTSNRKLTCPTCGYVTFLKARYTKHVKYHSMPFIKCEFCEFESQYSWNLERHMKNHNNSDEKKMKCPLCNFACDMKQSLTSHVQNHHKDVPEEILIKFRTSCASSPSRKSPNPGSRRQSTEYFVQELDILDYAYENQDEDEDDVDHNNQNYQTQQHQPVIRKKNITMHNNAQVVQGQDRSVFMKKFYKCRLCNFNALSELGLNRHVSESHDNNKNSGGGAGKKSSNIAKMPTLYKKCSANDTTTTTSSTSIIRSQLSNSNGMMAKPMPSLIPIPKSNLPTVSSSSLLNNTSHHQCQIPRPNSYQQIQSSHHHQDEPLPLKVKIVEDEDATKKKIQFLQSLGLTLKSSKKPSEDNKPLLSSYYNNNYRKVGPPQRRTSFYDKLTKTLFNKLTSNHNNSKENEEQTNQNLSQTSSETPQSTDNNSIMKNGNGNRSSIISNISITSNSTRCQYCRHRNKTSQDLMIHLEQCQEAQRFLAEEEEENEQEMEMDGQAGGGGDQHQIFVWNNNNGCAMEEEEEHDDYEDVDDVDDGINQENIIGDGGGEMNHFHNFEGFSGLTLDLENYERQMSSPRNGNINNSNNGGGTDVDIVSPKGSGNSVTKSRKVYKCPQKDCEFWATTASRFHVHIIGHYNSKPFECSQCSYRSNWRWDITKHIKLKTMRDPGHSKAKVILTDKSGERNYRKYDRYLVPMSVTYSKDSKLPDCSTVASKRSDVELDASPSPSSSRQQNRKSSPSPNPKMPSISNIIHSPASSASSSIQMPKLIKAPQQTTSSVDGNYSNLRQALNSTGSALPILTPSITISPYVPTKNKSSSSSASTAGRSFVDQRMLAGGELLQNMESLGREITVTPIRNSTNNSLQVPGQDNNRIWECKKCSFKSSNKTHVILHINQNHKPKSGESMSILIQNNLLELGKENNNDENNVAEIYNCDNCPFSTASVSDMYLHYENCNENCDGEVYTCIYCSEEFPSERLGRQHILLIHGVEDLIPALGEEEEEKESNCWDATGGGGSTQNNNELILPEEICVKPPRGSVAEQSGQIFKKYHCQECPYVTSSKGQFIYHKKFHIPFSNSPYKCSLCTYHVSHKHLLQQHIRVHNNIQELNNTTDENNQYMEIEGDGDNGDDDEEEKMDELFRSRPRVMAFNGDEPIYSVVRCRFCPKVFLSGRDLMEHENEHQNNEAPSKGGRINQYQNYDDEEDDENIDDGVLNLSINKSGPSSSRPTPPPHSLKKQPGQTSTSTTTTIPLYLCQQCPARFFYEKELKIHCTFHERRNQFKCQLCSYSARQQVPHLMSHMKVHSSEYQDKTRSLLLTKYKKAVVKFDSPSQSQTQQQQALHPPQRMPTLKRMPPVSISESNKTSKNNPGLVGASSPIPSCSRCPSTFSTLAGYISHSQRHGLETAFKCKNCDFGAQSQQHLVMHSIIHAGSEVTIEPEVVDFQLPKTLMNKGNRGMASTSFEQIPTVVPGGNDEVVDLQQLLSSSAGHLDYMDFSVAGAGAFQGNPEFKYQTYIKNGKEKSKRYKCFKCPSAFEKRDQYKVHMGLHGSNQRYKCSVCDYSVTYYANFIQHLKKHENQANVTKEQLTATPISRMNKSSTSTSPSKGQVVDESGEVKSNVKVPPLVLRVPKTLGGNNEPRFIKNHLACSQCPFKTDSSSALSEHEKGHGSKSLKEKCPFCSFSSNDKESIKGHLRVHFDVDFTPAVGVPGQNDNNNTATHGTMTPSPTDSSADSEVDDDYEAVVKKANKSKKNKVTMVSFTPAEISVKYC